MFPLRYEYNVVNRTYKTLGDLIYGYLDEDEGAYQRLQLGLEPIEDDDFVFPMLEWFFDSANADLSNTIYANPEMEELFCSYIFPRYQDHVIYYYDTEQDDSSNKLRWLSHFCNVYYRTYSKYKKILDAFTAQNLDLMADIKSKTTSKYNDTPQAAQSATYDWSTDNHLSNIAASETGSAGGTPIERLDEIRKGYENIYREWCDEFDSLFMEV